VTIDTKSFSEQALDQTSTWIVRLRSDQVTEQDRQNFALWLAESEDHQRAFDEMMVLWEAMGSGADHHGQSPISALLGKISTDNGPRASNDGLDQNTVQNNVQNNKTTANAAKVTLIKHTEELNKRQALAAFASLAASIFVIGVLWFNQQPSPSSQLTPAQTLFATPVGKQQRFSLEDGSTIELNTDSQVAVEYSSDLRQLHLIRGEAFFEVESDKNRPFIVTAGAGQVTAVGTAFNVQLSNAQLAGSNQPGILLVAVTEGRVTVTKTGTLAAEKSITVDIGQQTRVSEQGDLGLVEPADLELVSAWREKTLIFRTTNLATALTELNRYLAEPVDTSDASLSTLNVSGTFSLEEPEATLTAIIDAFDLQSYKNPFGNKTRLYRR